MKTSVARKKVARSMSTTAERAYAPPPGLVNIGNSCFLNAVLQSLASIRSVHTYLASFPQGKDDKDLTEALKATLRDLSLSRSSFAPYVKENPELKKKFLTKEQQDAHELMQFVLGKLDDQEQSAYAMSKSEGLKSLLSLVNSTESEQSAPDYGRNPFCGLMKSTLSLTCSKCGRVSSPCFQKFTTVSLSLPLRTKNWSLEESLAEFTVEEVVQDVECPYCEEKRTKAKKEQQAVVPKRESHSARKRLTFARTPKSLCLHLRRLVRGPSGDLVKSSCHLNFPLELDLTPFCSFSCGIEPPSPIARPPKRITLEDESDESDEIISQLINRKPFTGVKQKAPIAVPGLGGGSVYSHGEAENFANHKLSTSKSEKEPKQNSNGLSNLYQLVSVIVHHGSHLGGHYAVYRKLLTRPFHSKAEYKSFVAGKDHGKDDRDHPEEGGEWVYISDENVRKASVSEVLKSQAYMLYYERC